MPAAAMVPVATETDTTRPAAAAAWLTLDEVAERMRFRSRRSLLHYLRKHPAPLFQRVGSNRYFMRAQDVDRLMEPIDLPTAARRTFALPEDVDASSFVQVEAPPEAPRKRSRRAAKASSRPTRAR